MRGRLAIAVLVLGLIAWGIGATAAAAQVPPTNGELLPGGAGVTAQYHAFNGGDQEIPPSGTNSNRECWYTFDAGPSAGGRSSLADLQAALAAQQAADGGEKLAVQLVCQNVGGGNETSISVDWPPDGNTGALVAPETLAAWAEDRLWFPPPVGDMSPALGTGTFAQLPTYYWVENVEPGPVARAEAGGIWAEAFAEASSQHWTVQDRVRGTTYEFDCPGSGVAYNPATGDPVPAAACPPWTPPHSSAGLSATNSAGQACFPATVTINWQVNWRSNAAPGGALGNGQSAATTCIVVQEIQAVVTDG